MLERRLAQLEGRCALLFGAVMINCAADVQHRSGEIWLKYAALVLAVVSLASALEAYCRAWRIRRSA